MSMMMMRATQRRLVENRGRFSDLSLHVKVRKGMNKMSEYFSAGTPDTTSDTFGGSCRSARPTERLWKAGKKTYTMTVKYIKPFD